MGHFHLWGDLTITQIQQEECPVETGVTSMGGEMLRRIGLLSVFLLLVGTPYAFAATIDLVTNQTVTAADGTIWSRVVSSPTGTGVYEPFLRLQARGTEAGLNTDGNANATYDDKAGIWTHSLTYGDLGVVTVDSTNYYSLLILVC